MYYAVQNEISPIIPRTSYSHTYPNQDPPKFTHCMWFLGIYVFQVFYFFVFYSSDLHQVFLNLQLEPELCGLK